MHAPSILAVNPLEDGAAWDTRVLGHPDATFFHTSAWASVLYESYNFTPLYLFDGSEDRGQRTEDGTAIGNRQSAIGNHSATPNLQPAAETHNSQLTTHNCPFAALPLMEVRSPFTGRRGVSLPFTDLCPPLLSEAVPLQALLDALTTLGRERGWSYWECRGVKDPPSGIPASLTFLGHTLDLSVGEKALFENFKGTVRTALRKAEQAGVKVEAATTLDALQTFYRLHCRTRRKHGLPPQPFRFFRAIHQHILSRGHGQVVIARMGPRAIAANIYFHSGTKAIYKYGASDDAFQELRGSNFVMWHAIQSYLRQGYQSLHFGRTSTATVGLRRFKLGWGCREEFIHYLRYDCRQARFVPGEDEAFGWYNSLMTRMPVLCLRLLGTALYRHIA